MSGAQGMVPIIRGNKVTFRYHAPHAVQANVLGTFNHWDIVSGAMQRNGDGTWERTVDVPLEGSYDYKFLVDGEWILDPLNPDYGKDSKDRYNSRFMVTSSASGVDRLRGIAARLEAAPPGSGDPARAAALRDADAILQLPTAPHSRVLKDHFAERLVHLADTIRDCPGSLAGAVYCHGNVLKRAGRTIAVDAVTTRSVWGLYWDIPGKAIEAFCEACDALCITHLHPDHLDPLVVKHLLARGAPVFVPEELAGRFPEGVVPVPPDSTVSWEGWLITFHRGVHVYDERRMLVVRYLEVVAPDGFRMVHTTDHDYTQGVRTSGRVDLLVAKAGGVNPSVEGRERDAFLNLVAHVRPARFLAGHLNELGHPIRGGREPYGTGVAIVAEAGSQPAAGKGEVLHWGETWRLD